jgi:hypothetical protein
MWPYSDTGKPPSLIGAVAILISAASLATALAHRIGLGGLIFRTPVV